MHTRFIILSTARTGSNLLTFLLKSHKNVVMNGEIFNLNALEDSKLEHALTSPLSYISDYFDKGLSEDIKAVGFKQFYNHLRMEYFMDIFNPDETQDDLQEKITKLMCRVMKQPDIGTHFDKFERAWEYLRDETDIKVIHLKRENKFETLVSLKTAFITDQWWKLRGQDSPKTFLKVQPEECRSFFEQIDFYESFYADMFRMHPVLHVDYKGLAEDRDSIMHKVFEFLDLPSLPVKAPLAKQIAFPMNEIVTNYNELKQHFFNTQWSRYFQV